MIAFRILVLVGVAALAFSAAHPGAPVAPAPAAKQIAR
jgi:hypothetical protein